MNRFLWTDLFMDSFLAKGFIIMVLFMNRFSYSPFVQETKFYEPICEPIHTFMNRFTCKWCVAAGSWRREDVVAFVMQPLFGPLHNNVTPSLTFNCSQRLAHQSGEWSGRRTCMCHPPAKDLVVDVHDAEQLFCQLSPKHPAHQFELSLKKATQQWIWRHGYFPIQGVASFKHWFVMES